MYQKRNSILYYFFTILLFFITATTPQAMDSIEDNEDLTEVTSENTVESLMGQNVFDLLDGCTPDSRRQDSQSSASSQEESGEEQVMNFVDLTVQYTAEHIRKPKTWLFMCGGGAAAISLLPSGILMSGFGNLSAALVYSWVHPNSAVSSILISTFLNAFDPDHILQTVLFAVPPCLTQSIWAYHAVDWTFTHLSSCYYKASKNNLSGGWRETLLKVAYSPPIIHLNGFVYEAFYFNLVATQVSHHHGFGGGNVWAFILGGLSLPISYYLFDYLNRDPHQSPLYSLTKEQEEALEKIYIVQYIADRDGVTEGNQNGLDGLLQVLENPNPYAVKARNTTWKSVFDQIELKDLKNIKYWYRVKRNIARYASSFVQVAGLPFKGWVVYSLANKLCWLTDKVSPDLAGKIAIGTTAVLTIPLVLGAIAEQPRLQQSYWHILNGFKPEVFGYWGQRVAPLMVMGLSLWYLGIPTAYSYQREVEYDYYGKNCTGVSYTNCTGDYFGDLGPGIRFFDAAIFTGGIVWAASVHWFYQPVERTVRWIVKKTASPVLEKTLSLTEKLRDIKNRIWSWTSAQEEDSLIGSTQ